MTDMFKITKKFTLSLLYFFTSAISFSQGIVFDSSNYNTALLRAKNENKYIFLDAYTSWCLPCKIIEKEVFAAKEVSDVYQPKFISLKVDMEKGEGIELRKKFNVNSFPTLIYLNSSGQVVNKVSSALSKEQFIELGIK